MFYRPANKNITDEDLLLFLRHAADFEIRGLLLQNCHNITDAGLAHIKNLTSLNELYLVGNRITDAAINDFRTARPDVIVLR